MKRRNKLCYAAMSATFGLGTAASGAQADGGLAVTDGGPTPDIQVAPAPPVPDVHVEPAPPTPELHVEPSPQPPAPSTQPAPEPGPAPSPQPAAPSPQPAAPSPQPAPEPGPAPAPQPAAPSPQPAPDPGPAPAPQPAAPSPQPAAPSPQPAAPAPQAAAPSQASPPPNAPAETGPSPAPVRSPAAPDDSAPPLQGGSAGAVQGQAHAALQETANVESKPADSSGDAPATLAVNARPDEREVHVAAPEPTPDVHVAESKPAPKVQVAPAPPTPAVHVESPRGEASDSQPSLMPPAQGATAPANLGPAPNGSLQGSSDSLQGGARDVARQLQPAADAHTVEAASGDITPSPAQPAPGGGGLGVVPMVDVRELKRINDARDAFKEGTTIEASNIGRALRTSESKETRSEAGRELPGAGRLKKVGRVVGKGALGAGAVLDFGEGKADGRSTPDAAGHSVVSTAGSWAGGVAGGALCLPPEILSGGLATGLCVGGVAFGAAAGEHAGSWLYEHAKRTPKDSGRTRCGSGADHPCDYKQDLPPVLVFPL